MLPLEDIKILDLSRVLAGPFCSMILGDFGAEVIKIENPDGGDDTRAWGPPFIEGESAYFLSVNRNKKSVTVNLKSEEGKKFIWDLVKSSDVLLENFRPGTLDKLGFSYEAVAKANPKIIYASISGYGQSGPEKLRPGYDLVAQGMSGIMDITGSPDGSPTKVGTSIGDLVAGLYGVIGILLALQARNKIGKGQRVDVSLLDGQISLLTYQAGIYFASGKIPKRRGNQHPTICPYETFHAKDGYINLAVGSEKLWAEFCDVIGKPELKNDPKFAANKDRVEHRDELFPLLDKMIGKKPVNYWLELFDKTGVPAGPILSVDKVFQHPQVLAREMVVETIHKKIGKMKLTGIPVKLSDSPGSVRFPPPLLGEHDKKDKP